ncbi:MAG: hypothetical protein KGI57_06810, partial [Hyphomicrobiales bacterium]|nr:hypothetical protein [Hyphomicrobiales bacterium]
MGHVARGAGAGRLHGLVALGGGRVRGRHRRRLFRLVAGPLRLLAGDGAARLRELCPRLLPRRDVPPAVRRRKRRRRAAGARTPLSARDAAPPGTPSGADLLCDALVANGVATCFANPGTSEMHFVAALDRRPEIHCSLALFEGVATGAADGYARVAGKPAAVLLHTGPGLGNGLANLHNARRAGTPMLVVVGDHATHHLRHDAPLTSDIDAIAGACAIDVRRVRSTAAIPRDVAASLSAALTKRGPAVLILPADLS